MRPQARCPPPRPRHQCPPRRAPRRRRRPPRPPCRDVREVTTDGEPERGAAPALEIGNGPGGCGHCGHARDDGFGLRLRSRHGPRRRWACAVGGDGGRGDRAREVQHRPPARLDHLDRGADRGRRGARGRAGEWIRCVGQCDRGGVSPATAASSSATSAHVSGAASAAPGAAPQGSGTASPSGTAATSGPASVSTPAASPTSASPAAATPTTAPPTTTTTAPPPPVTATTGATSA